MGAAGLATIPGHCCRSEVTPPAGDRAEGLAVSPAVEEVAVERERQGREEDERGDQGGVRARRAQRAARGRALLHPDRAGRGEATHFIKRP